LGARSGVALPWTGRVGTCEIRLQEAKRHAAGSRRRCLPVLPIRLSPRVAAYRRVVPLVACNGSKPRHARERQDRSRGANRALPAGSASRPQDSGKGRAWEAFRYARLPPRGVSPPLTSPCPAHCRDTSGARRIFATGASRAATSTARHDSPDEFFIPTFRYRRSPVRPNVPVGAVPAVRISVRATCCISSDGVSNQPRAQVKYRFIACSLRMLRGSRSGRTALGIQRITTELFGNFLAFWPAVASALGKLYSE
jgi:hypothetical protein